MSSPAGIVSAPPSLPSVSDAAERGLGGKVRSEGTPAPCRVLGPANLRTLYAVCFGMAWNGEVRIKRSVDGRFPSAVSGNPGGRPKRLENLEIALAGAHDAPKVLEVVEKLRELAIAGDVQAARVYLDRVGGPVRPNDDERIEARAKEMLEHLLEEARAKRAAEGRRPTES